MSTTQRSDGGKSGKVPSPPWAGAAWWLALGLALLALLSTPTLKGDEKAPPSKLPSLEQALAEHASTILEHLRKDPAYRRIGVLKFRVQRGEGAVRDNAGPLNLRLAERLEVALVLALKEDDNMVLLRGASESVARSKNKRANHLTENGRRACFEIKTYTPAWGTETEEKVDVLLTGVVKFDPKTRAVKVTVEAFDCLGKVFKDWSFEAALEPRLLVEAGVSYALSRGGALKLNELEGEGERKSAREVLEEAPIKFEVLYDKEAQKIVDSRTVKGEVGGDSSVREPKELEEVSFRLAHRGTDKRRYGVVLLVNGKNTIYPDESQTGDLEGYVGYYKWILKPGATVEVMGFQKSVDTHAKFKVAPSYESAPSEIHYREHAGTFSVVIFRETETGDATVDPVKGDTPAGTIARGFLNADSLTRPSSLESLQAELRARKAPSGSRGVIGEGDRDKFLVEPVPFKAYPKEIAAVTIRYCPRPGE